MDYTLCDVNAPPALGDANVPANVKRWMWDNSTSTCTLEFEIDEQWTGPVFLYYGLTKYASQASADHAAARPNGLVV